MKITTAKGNRIFLFSSFDVRACEINKNDEAFVVSLAIKNVPAFVTLYFYRDNANDMKEYSKLLTYVAALRIH